jgi:hypothetical protein
MAAPAAALASSAGDQQYIDPLVGTTTGASPSHTQQPSRPAATPPAPAMASTPPAASSSSSSSSSRSSTSPDPSPPVTGRATLPFTGFPGWLAALVGAALLCGGGVLRRAVRDQ